MKAIIFAACIVACAIPRLAYALDLDNEDDIASYLKDYKSSSGRPMFEYLKTYGITIFSLTIDSVPDEKGERKLEISAVTKFKRVKKVPPCDIAGWYKRLPEIVSDVEKSSNGKYSSDDPIFFWAATGKCAEGWTSP